MTSHQLGINNNKTSFYRKTGSTTGTTVPPSLPTSVVPGSTTGYQPWSSRRVLEDGTRSRLARNLVSTSSCVGGRFSKPLVHTPIRHGVSHVRIHILSEVMFFCQIIPLSQFFISYKLVEYSIKTLSLY
jgi:hypothetical protein